MFNIPFIFRDGYIGGSVLPIFGDAKAIVWLDAQKSVYSDYGLTPAGSGSEIKQWNDQTSYANNVTGQTSDTPNYGSISFSPSGSTALFPYVEFNETDNDFLATKINPPSLTAITSGFTLFMVMRRNPGGAWSPGDNPIVEWNASWTSSDEGFGIDGDSTPSVLQCWYENNSINRTSIDIPWGSGGIDSTKFYYYTYRMSAGTCTGYVGQTLKAGPTLAIGSNKTMRTPNPVNKPKLYICSGFDGTTFKQSSMIDMTELIIYNNALSDSNMSSVWKYLRQKYGFVASP